VVAVVEVEQILEMFATPKVKTVDQAVVLQLIAQVQVEVDVATLLLWILLKEIMEERLLVLEVVQVVVDIARLEVTVVLMLAVQVEQEQI
jgi:hypothetical protein